jgi:hypothetical protein
MFPVPPGLTGGTEDKIKIIEMGRFNTKKNTI